MGCVRHGCNSILHRDRQQSAVWSMWQDAEGIGSGQLTEMGSSSSVIYLPLVTKFAYRYAPVEVG